MKILALTEFKIGKMVFEKNRSYEVPDAQGARFVANGWAEPSDSSLSFTVPNWIMSPLPAERSGETLEIQDIHQVLGMELR